MKGFEIAPGQREEGAEHFIGKLRAALEEVQTMRRASAAHEINEADFGFNERIEEIRTELMNELDVLVGPKREEKLQNDLPLGQ